MWGHNSWHAATKKTYHSRLNAERDMRIHCLLLNQTLKRDLQECKTMPFLTFKIENIDFLI